MDGDHVQWMETMHNGLGSTGNGLGSMHNGLGSMHNGLGFVQTHILFVCLYNCVCLCRSQAINFCEHPKREQIFACTDVFTPASRAVVLCLGEKHIF